MTIIHLKQRLTQFLDPVTLNQQAKCCKFMQRIRDIQPLQLVTSLIAAFSQGNTNSIAELQRQFNGMQLSEADFVAYKPFHNQLRKSAFPIFMERLTRMLMAQLMKQQQGKIPSKFRQFERILLHDGSSFAIHNHLKDEFPGRFSTVSPAAVECHVTMSLLEQTPVNMTIAADTLSEHGFRPAADTLRRQLLLADAGYLDQDYYHQIAQHGGYYLVRGKLTLNPTIVEARNGQGRLLPKLAGKKLKDVTRRDNRSDVLDMIVRSSKLRYRLVRRWFAPVGDVQEVVREALQSTALHWGKAADLHSRNCHSLYGCPIGSEPTSWVCPQCSGQVSTCTKHLIIPRRQRQALVLAHQRAFAATSLAFAHTDKHRRGNHLNLGPSFDRIGEIFLYT